MRIKFVGEAPLDAEGEVNGKTLSFHLNPGYVYDLSGEQVALLRKLGQEKFVQQLHFNFPVRPVPDATSVPVKPKADAGPGPKPDDVPTLPEPKLPVPKDIHPSDPYPPNDAKAKERELRDPKDKGPKKPR